MIGFVCVVDLWDEEERWHVVRRSPWSFVWAANAVKFCAEFRVWNQVHECEGWSLEAFDGGGQRRRRVRHTSVMRMFSLTVRLRRCLPFSPRRSGFLLPKDLSGLVQCILYTGCIGEADTTRDRALAAVSPRRRFHPKTLHASRLRRRAWCSADGWKLRSFCVQCRGQIFEFGLMFTAVNVNVP